MDIYKSNEKFYQALIDMLMYFHRNERIDNIIISYIHEFCSIKPTIRVEIVTDVWESLEYIQVPLNDEMGDVKLIYKDGQFRFYRCQYGRPYLTWKKIREQEKAEKQQEYKAV